MHFAHPAALAWLALILLLLFARRRRVRLPVANLYLWADGRAQSATPLARRVRRHRLLILQAAFLAAVAFALATPLATSSVRRIALVVDVSMSMGATANGSSRLDRARTDAGALLATLPRSTSVQLIAAASTPSVVGSFQAGDAALERALIALIATDGTANVQAAVQSALAATPSPERIHVFSDGEHPLGLPEHVVWSSAAGAANNVALTGLTSRRSPATGNRQVLATISNYGDSPVRPTLQVAINDASVGEQLLTIAPGGSARASFTVPDTQGIVVARLRHDDVLTADNVRTLLLVPVTRIRTLMIDRDGRGGFVRKALAANDDVELNDASPDSNADVIVCQGCAELPPGTAGVLLFPPTSFAGEAVALTRIDNEHPVAEGLALDGVLGQPLLAPAPGAGSRILARAGDLPAVVAYESLSRRVVEVRLDPGGEPFALSTAFPVLIANAIDWLASPGSSGTSAIAGEPLRVASDGTADLAAMIGSNGRPTHVTAQNGIVTIDAAGVYHLRERTFVVNPAAGSESDLRAPSVSSELDAGPSRSTDAEPRDLTAPILLAALLLLGIEWRFRTS